MSRADETQGKSWHDRAIEEKAHRDASAGQYDPPPSRSLWARWFSDRAAYNAGWQAGKSAVKKELDLRGAFLRRTDLSFANLEDAKLGSADFSNANFRGADFKNADLEGTILKGADLSETKNLTISQISRAILDENTKLPDAMRDVLLDREHGEGR